MKLDDKEEWRDINGYEGLYQVSNIGNIKRLKSYVKHSLGGNKTVNERILKFNSVRKYRGFTLCSKNGQKDALVHRMVASAFIPNPNNKPCVNHIDGDPTNNNVNNLEWCTYQENEQHSYRVLGKIGSKKNLRNYEESWETPLKIGSYTIRGSARKTMYEMLCDGMCVDDLTNELKLSSFHKLVMALRKHGTIITTRGLPNTKKVFYKIFNNETS